MIPEENRELSGLLLLLEDRDPQVREQVLHRLLRTGESVLPELTRICRDEPSPERRRRLSAQLPTVSREMVIASLRKLAERQDDGSLTEGVYLISRLLDPGLAFDRYYRRVVSLGQEFLLEIRPERTGAENVKRFNQVFYHRLGFRMEDPKMTDSAYASAWEALESRSCNPAVLTLLYFLFARFAGLDLVPLSLGGGLLPAYVEADRVLFYVNMGPAEGTLMTDEQLRDYCRLWHISLEKDCYGLVAESEVLVLYLEMLRNMYREKPDLAVWLDRALDLFPGEPAPDEEDD